MPVILQAASPKRPEIPETLRVRRCLSFPNHPGGFRYVQVADEIDRPPSKALRSVKQPFFDRRYEHDIRASCILVDLHFSLSQVRLCMASY